MIIDIVIPSINTGRSVKRIECAAFRIGEGGCLTVCVGASHQVAEIFAPGHWYHMRRRFDLEQAEKGGVAT